jgi:hypothetical protein
MSWGIATLVGGNPAARFLAATAAVAVLVGDGLMLVGYTAQVRGQALPALSAPAGDPDEPLLGGGIGAQPTAPAPNAAAGSLPGMAAPAAPVAPLAPAAPVAPIAPVAPVAPVAPRTSRSPEAGSPPRPRSEHRWPASMPDPERFERHDRGPSPFARRCADGEISATWCHGMPN